MRTLSCQSLTAVLQSPGEHKKSMIMSWPLCCERWNTHSAILACPLASMNADAS